LDARPHFFGLCGRQSRYSGVFLFEAFALLIGCEAQRFQSPQVSLPFTALTASHDLRVS
jgi:hypothetical protein